METRHLRGKAVADHIRSELAGDIKQLKSSGVIAGLAAVLIGEDPASQMYVRSKARAFAKAQCFSKTYHLPAETSETELLKLIRKLNIDSRFHGILIQLPLPKHIDSNRILNSVDPRKDVDGFHPVNLGHLMVGQPRVIPCTPHGILKMMEFYQIPTSGRAAVILGRSTIVGKPMAALLGHNTPYGNATVTMCHTRTRDIWAITSQADILIAASGQPGLISGKVIKQGVDIIDVGINRVEDDSEKGYRIEGDVNFESVQGIAASITPVPGGVGVMTITMLLYNTVQAALRAVLGK